MNLFLKKPIDRLLAESEGAGEKGGGLKRTLSATSLVALGIAASTHAGPALVYSFILAAIGCAFAGLCYSEFFTMIPIAGSAYTYAYATMGELLAWIIGWALILEYAVGAATVAVNWSATIASILADFNIRIPQAVLASPFDMKPGAVNLAAVVIVAATASRGWAS
jgi:APA family basic amino acid/polyamine antiporter